MVFGMGRGGSLFDCVWSGWVWVMIKLTVHTPPALWSCRARSFHPDRNRSTAEDWPKHAQHDAVNWSRLKAQQRVRLICSAVLLLFANDASCEVESPVQEGWIYFTTNKVPRSARSFYPNQLGTFSWKISKKKTPIRLSLTLANLAAIDSVAWATGRALGT